MFSLNHVREVWKRFADEFGAQHIIVGFEPYGHNMLDKVVYEHKGVAITLDSIASSRTTSTRIYAPVAVSGNLDFGISPEHFFARVEKFFGAQDIEIGDQIFDEKLIVKTENPEKLRLFLSNQKIRELLLAISSHHSVWGISLQIGETELAERGTGGIGFDDLPGKGDYLVIIQNGIIDNAELLKLSFQLAIESLEQLKKLE